MKSLNKVQIIGNLGADPDVRYTAAGDAVVNLSVATDEGYKKKDGTQVDKTEWHRVVAYGKLAEIMEKYLKKGSKVYVEGKIQTKKWQDKSGQDRYTTDCVVRDMLMLDGKGGSLPSLSEPAAPSLSLDDDLPF